MATTRNEKEPNGLDRRHERSGRHSTGETTAFDLSEIAKAKHGPRPKIPMLLVVDGVEKGRPIILEAGRATFGRGAMCDISIQGRGISRSHMRVIWDADAKIVTVEDAGSTNGVYVEGERITRTTIIDGDVVYLGPETAMRLEFTPDTDAMLRVRQYENSIVDDLTGIHNRRYLMSSLEHEMAFASRHSQNLCLLLVDIDHFKQVNDVHGHQVGDAVIQQLAGLIADSLRAEDSFARLGGEEFAIVSRGLSAENAMNMAERLRTQVEAHVFHREDVTLFCTVSVGGAVIRPGRNQDTAQFLKHADENLYKAKNEGRNRTVIE